MSLLMYDGHDLSEIGVCGNPEITPFGSKVKYDESDNRDGSIVLGRVLTNSKVAFQIGIKGTASERRNKLSTLAAWLTVDDSRPLVLPDTPERYYMAIHDGEVQTVRGINGEIAQLEFVITNPIAYGEKRTVVVPSGGSITFRVGGTAKTKPRITASAVRNATSLVWGIRLDEGDFVHVATGAAAARSVVLDCDERTLAVNSAVAIPTLDSDWLELSPGEHTLRMDNGTGAATVEFLERWY
jgi:predicted phage tail component-like protein